MDSIEKIMDAWAKYQHYCDTNTSDSDYLDRTSFFDFMSWINWGYDPTARRRD